MRCPAPRGNLITFWDAKAGRLVDQMEVVDGCGVAPGDAPGEFVITGGRGQVLRFAPGHDDRTPLVVAAPTIAAWDNHLVMARGQSYLEETINIIEL